MANETEEVKPKKQKNLNDVPGFKLVISRGKTYRSILRRKGVKK